MISLPKVRKNAKNALSKAEKVKKVLASVVAAAAITLSAGSATANQTATESVESFTVLNQALLLEPAEAVNELAAHYSHRSHSSHYSHRSHSSHYSSRY